MQVILLVLLGVAMIFGRAGIEVVFVPLVIILLAASLVSIGWACLRQLRLKFRS